MDALYKASLLNFLLRILMIVFLMPFGGFSHKVSEAQSDAKKSSQIAQFLQEADKYFELQDFQPSYQFYRNVLALDPLHHYARERIYEIAKIYQTLEDVAIQQQNQEEADIFRQEYRTIIRYLLTLLTNQLQHFLDRYAEYTRIEDSDEETREHILTVLENILIILREIQMIYEQFPQNDTTSAQMVERIKGAIDKYQQEYTRYNISE